jgi:hypothetical protein
MSFKVYQVYGSEDGTTGIFSSKKRAMASAIDYVKNAGDETPEVDDSMDWITFITGNSVEAKVESWIVE